MMVSEPVYKGLSSVLEVLGALFWVVSIVILSYEVTRPHVLEQCEA